MLKYRLLQINALFQSIKRAEAHISLVSKERNHYRKSCKECKDNVRSAFTIENNYVPAMSRDTTIHYSFDMAQQVSIKVYVYVCLRYVYVCLCLFLFIKV